MAESRAPSAKKAKRITAIGRVNAQERARQYKEDMYADDGVLFCKFCEHSVDFVRVDTIKDHLKSKKHRVRKRLKLAKPKSHWPVAVGKLRCRRWLRPKTFAKSLCSIISRCALSL